jgi:hypothetical protein
MHVRRASHGSAPPLNCGVIRLRNVAADSYKPERDISDDFRRTVAAWMRSAEELLVVLRYLRAGGAKDYAFISSEAEFDSLINVCPVGTDIVVFRDPQLPIRGTVDATFINDAADRFKNGEEYLCVFLRTRSVGDPRLPGEMGETVRGLIEDLNEHIGERVAIGPCPNFVVGDNASMISRSKGGIDGPR